MSAEVMGSGSAFVRQTPAPFTATARLQSARRGVYDVTPDDGRLLVGLIPGAVAVGASGDAATIMYVLVNNFFEELKRLVP
jgi:hypothetical protein